MSLFPGRASPRLFIALAAATLFAVPSFGQPSALLPVELPPAPPPAVTEPSPLVEKRVLWIFPNYRTVPTPAVYQPLTSRQKFDLAVNDTFDRGTVATAAVLAGKGLWMNSNPSFGSGVAAYGHYFVTAYADLAIGDFMTEAIYPSLLHQDPRYFRRGTGGGFGRLGYAVGQIFWTHTDSGGAQFNYSEIGGNATAVAISNAYYPDSRNASSASKKFGTQLAIDMASNVLKEFWPDVHKKLSHDGSQSWLVNHP
jgi:hypothetical protein